MGILYRITPASNKQIGGVFRWFPDLTPSNSWEVKVRTFRYYIGEFAINTWWKCIEKDEPNTACLADFKLHHTCRGIGFGNQMMTDAICLCDGFGFKSIKLSVAADNKIAVGLYKKFGFETRLATGGGMFLLMEKML